MMTGLQNRWALFALCFALAGCSWQHDFELAGSATAEEALEGDPETLSADPEDEDPDQEDRRGSESRHLIRYLVSRTDWHAEIRSYPLIIGHIDANQGLVAIWSEAKSEEDTQQISEGYYLGLVRTKVDPREILAASHGFAADDREAGAAEERQSESPPRDTRRERRRSQILETAEIYSPDTLAIRVQVTKIFEGLVEFAVPPAICRHLQVGDRIGLVRPAGSTTRDLKRMPAVLPVCFNSVDERPVSSQERMAVAHRQLRQIADAIRSYHDAHGVLPPAVVRGPDGTPWHSWRTLLLPYLGEESRALHAEYRFSEPWNSSHNRRLLSRCPKVYRHLNSNDVSSTQFAVPISDAATSGMQTAFSSSGITLLPEHSLGETLVAGTGLNVSRSTFAASPEQLVLVGTVPPDSRIPWSKPTDCLCDSLRLGLGSRQSFAPSFPHKRRQYGLFLFADGTIRGVSDLLPMDMITRMLIVDDGPPLDFQNDAFLDTEPLAAATSSPPPGRVELLVSLGSRYRGLFIREQSTAAPRQAEPGWNSADVSQAR